MFSIPRTWGFGIDQRSDCRIAAQSQQAAAAGGPDARGRNAELGADLGMRHRRVLDNYLHTATAAGQHFAIGFTSGLRPPAAAPALAPRLATLQQATAWLEIERPNLHAAVDYAARARLPHAIQIPAAM
jgi:hypothetical protein